MSDSVLSTDPHWILYLIPLFMGTCIYAIRCGFPVLAFSEWMVMVTSIYYWSNYNSNYYRSIDIAAVQLALYIHLYYTIKYKSKNILFLYIFVIILYFIGRHYNSYIIHSFVWITGSIATVLLIKHLCKVNETEDICLRDNFCKKKLCK